MISFHSVRIQHSCPSTLVSQQNAWAGEEARLTTIESSRFGILRFLAVDASRETAGCFVVALWFFICTVLPLTVEKTTNCNRFCARDFFGKVSVYFFYIEHNVFRFH